MPQIRSHWWPRTRAGRTLTVAFLVLMAFAQPPLVFLLANRVEPRVAGIPFLYVWLGIIYVLMILVLLSARKREL